MPHTLLVLLAVCVCVTSAEDIRGVPKSGQPGYESPLFACKDGSDSIEIAKVNDDYCDCTDGSDEPGTSACSTAPASRFYCVNKGHRGQYVFTSRVNDGVCDCCDGSDEWDLSVECANSCAEVNERWLVDNAETIRVHEEGAVLKKQYVDEGRRALANQQARVAELTQEKADHEALRAGLVEVRDAAVAVEAAERKLASSSLVADVVRRLRLAELDTDGLHELVVELATRASAGEHLAAILKDRLVGDVPLGATDTAATDTAATDTAATDTAAADDEADAVADAAATPQTDGERVSAVLKGLEDKDAYVNEEAKHAREQVEEYDGKIARTQTRLTEAQADSEVGKYGVDAEFWHMKGQCYKTTSQGYDYEVCPFGTAKQGHVSLGDWTPPGTPAVESPPPAAEGPHMLFRSGAQCWNGPKRSMTLKLECGTTTMLRDVFEPSVCEYAGVLVTPAACDLNHAAGINTDLNMGMESEELAQEAREEL